MRVLMFDPVRCTPAEADYLASYGPVCAGGRALGRRAGGYFTVGSPRFDRCLKEREDARARGARVLKSAGLDLNLPVLLAAVPGEGYAAQSDSYAFADFFRTVRAAQERVPGMQVVLKFRPGERNPEPRHLVQELFGESAVCMDKENLFDLLCASSAAMCGNSTVIYEALLAGVPLVLHPWRRSDTYHAQMYAPAAPIAYSVQELETEVGKIFGDEAYRAQLVARQKLFLTGYALDGHSSERLAALLEAPLTPRPL